MHHAPTLEDQQNFYLEEICPRADDLLRFCYSLCLTRSTAQDLVSRVFTFAIENLHDFIKAPSPLVSLLTKAWEYLPSSPAGTINESHPIVSIMSPLSRDERMAIISLDIMSLGEKDCCRITGWDVQTLQKHACNGRLKILEF